MSTNQQEHILSGYKVLDFTQHVAGPTATRLLVEMGAEVIKVELAPGGEPTRYAPYLKEVLGLAFSADGGRLYVSFTNQAGDSQLDEYEMRDAVARRRCPSTLKGSDTRFLWWRVSESGWKAGERHVVCFGNGR